MKKLLLLLSLVLVSSNVLSRAYYSGYNHGYGHSNPYHYSDASKSYNGDYLSALSKDGATPNKTCFCGFNEGIVKAVNTDYDMNTDYANCCDACNQVRGFNGYVAGWSLKANANSYIPNPSRDGSRCALKGVPALNVDPLIDFMPY